MLSLTCAPLRPPPPRGGRRKLCVRWPCVGWDANVVSIGTGTGDRRTEALVHTRNVRVGWGPVSSGSPYCSEDTRTTAALPLKRNRQLINQEARGTMHKQQQQRRSSKWEMTRARGWNTWRLNLLGFTRTCICLEKNRRNEKNHCTRTHYDDSLYNIFVQLRTIHYK